MLHVGLDGRVVKLASDQSLGVEDGVGGVDGDLYQDLVKINQASLFKD